MKEAKKVIENGGVVYTTDEDRKIGKTTNIVAYSIWTEKPILTGKMHLVSHYQDKGAVAYFVDSNNLGSLKGRRDLTKGVLVDEFFDETLASTLATEYGITISGFFYEGARIKGVKL